jgi:hypothetical protein
MWTPVVAPPLCAAMPVKLPDGTRAALNFAPLPFDLSVTDPEVDCHSESFFPTATMRETWAWFAFEIYSDTPSLGTEAAISRLDNVAL